MENLTIYLLLSKLIDNGTVFIDDFDEYVGIASDNEYVCIGNVGNELDVESYLTSHPTPDTW